MAVRGDIEVGLVRELHHPALETLTLYDDELVLVVEPRHPLAAASTRDASTGSATRA